MRTNRTYYNRAVSLADTAEKLIKNGKAPTIVQALKILELAMMQESNEVLESIDTHLEEIDKDIFQLVMDGQDR